MQIFVNAVGASKNIGYFSAIHFLSVGHTVVFFLRSPAVLEGDSTVQPYLKSRQATVLKGDALNQQEVQEAWKGANENSSVDVLLYTVGGTPKFKLSKGLVISPADLTTRALSNVLQSVASTHNSKGPSSMARLIAVTSTGVTKASHDTLPFGFKLFYSYALQSPHADKLGMERLLQHAMGKKWEEGVEPAEEVLAPGWEKSYPPLGWLPQTVIIRPALLTDRGVSVVYKVSMEEFPSYTISRKGTAHFIGTRLLPEWSTWSGKVVNLGN